MAQYLRPQRYMLRLLTVRKPRRIHVRKLLVALFILFPVSSFAGTVSLPYSDKMDTGSNWNFDYDAPKFVSDATTPDPSNVMQWTFETGFTDGNAPGIATLNISTTNELYFQYYFKYSSNWTYHPVENKQCFVWANNSLNNFYVAVGLFSREMAFDLQAAGGSQVLQSKGVNIQSNRWYKVTGHVIINTGSNSDGTAQMWLDDVLIINRTGVRFWNNADKFGSFAFTPVWGGYEGAKVPSTQYLYLDALRLQTTPIGTSSLPKIQPAPPTGLRFN
jgi:hypothetical protein